MSNQLKTQLSLILIAGIGAAGLTGFFVQSIKTNFALKGNSNTQEVVASAQSDSESQTGASSENGTVLGVSENAQLNPLKAIYVNPFASVADNSVFSGKYLGNKASSGDVILMSAMQPEPTAPIQSYLRGYVYPIAELDNCVSGQDCFEYCEQLGNLPVCAMFSERQGYMKMDMIPVAQRMAIGFLSDKNFADCNTANSCVALCDQESYSGICSEFSNSYELSSRVLGAADGATESVQPTAGTNLMNSNPYQSLSQDYSNRNLNDYLASVTGSGCAPLDMICMSQKEQQTSGNPRVLNVSIEDLMNNDNGGGSGGGGSGDPVEWNGDYNNNPGNVYSDITNCGNNATANIAYRDPATILPYEQEQAQTNVNNCIADYADTAKEGNEEKRQETINDQIDFQNCIAGSKNLAVDVKRCIGQELY